MVYGSNRFFSWNNLALLGWLGLGYLWIFHYPANQNKLYHFVRIIVLFYQLVWGVLVCWNIFRIVKEMFYFELTDEQFIIKNYLLPFSRVRYQLNEIESIELRKKSDLYTKYTLCIIGNDKKPKCFKNSDIKLKVWQSMMADFKTRGIDVMVDKSLNVL